MIATSTTHWQKRMPIQFGRYGFTQIKSKCSPVSRALRRVYQRLHSGAGAGPQQRESHTHRITHRVTHTDRHTNTLSLSRFLSRTHWHLPPNLPRSLSLRPSPCLLLLTLQPTLSVSVHTSSVAAHPSRAGGHVQLARAEPRPPRVLRGSHRRLRLRYRTRGGGLCVLCKLSVSLYCREGFCVVCIVALDCPVGCAGLGCGYELRFVFHPLVIAVPPL
jgi:hypothetical protein